jgi:hypothetical protein
MTAARSFLAACLVLAFAAVAAACTIPVFRYALERWELTPYEIVVFHKAPLPADVRTVLTNLERGQPAVNAAVHVLEVDAALPKPFRTLYEKHGKGQPLPWMAVRLADAEAQAPPAWSGALSVTALRAVLDSPMRRKIVDELKKGTTATFLLLKSGDAEADGEAQKLVEKELTRLEKAIELPEQSEEGPQLRTGLPLKVVFKILPMDRGDPAEDAFLKIVMATEDELDKVKGPILLPVFGRGRLLCSLFGKDIDRSQIAQVARFLCSECSCQVKELNPGVDLMIQADWRDLLEKAGPPAVLRPDRPPLNKLKKK